MQFFEMVRGIFLNLYSLTHLNGQTFSLRYDNDPTHTDRVINNYLHCQVEKGVQLQMAWPPQSLDLNVIENVCDYMKRQKTMSQSKATNVSRNIGAHTTYQRNSFFEKNKL